MRVHTCIYVYITRYAYHCVSRDSRHCIYMILYACTYIILYIYIYIYILYIYIDIDIDIDMCVHMHNSYAYIYIYLYYIYTPVCVYTVITNGFSSFHCSCTILKSRGQRYPCHFLCQRSWVTCGKDIDQGRLIYVPATVSTVDFLFLFMSCALFLRSRIWVR